MNGVACFESIDSFFVTPPRSEAALRYYAARTDNIEVTIDGKLEQIIFPIPRLCQYLTESSKTEVYMTTDVDEEGSKVK